MGARISSGAESKQDYATPPDFITAVERRFGPITFDLAASAHNTKHALYFDKATDALKQAWHEFPSGLLWLNPPFSHIEPWAKKCSEESALGARIAFLVPAAIGSNWYRDWCWKQSFTHALNGRLHFDPNNPRWGYPKDCMLAMYDNGLHGFEVWDWRQV